MTTEHVEEKVRETLHAVALDRVRAPGDLAEQVMRRRGRRRVSQAAGAAVAVAAITVGAVLGFGGGDGSGQDRPVRPAASPEGWKAWQKDAPGASERGCLVDGSALYCAGYKYDAAKFDANTGERLWAVKVNGEGDGIDHPFAVRDGVVYGYRNHTVKKQPNGDYMGGTDLMAVDAESGDVLWKKKMPQDDRTDQAAMLINGAVFANTPSLRTMSALDPRTGEEKWHYTWKKGIACERAVLSGVPHLLCTRDTDKPHDTDVFRLSPASGAAEKVTTLPGRHLLMGSTGDRMVLAGERKPSDRKLRLTTVNGSGAQTWHSYRMPGEGATTDVIGDRLISVTREGKASAYSVTTGKTLWTAPAGIKMPHEDAFMFIAAPVVSQRQGVVYFLNPTGDLSALDLRTGEKVWHTRVDIDEPGPGRADTPQLLLYQDVLVALKGSKMVSLLPRTGG
ncbi:PQQ-binding-like beta-propeller repeat protein [Streptomyces sp. NPDC046925]|uniref:outer membrane protein assembly factor BamB family protein n=1 Tax=Streptomyces sp. NPDC046925 TaxID=3155375 RepID=UPI00340D4E53